MKNAIDITVLLDRSGSMGSIREATVESLNGFIVEQKNAPGNGVFSLIQFDGLEPHKITRNVTKLKDIQQITYDEYVPRASTPLYEAICLTIDSVGKRLAEMFPAERPDKVVFVIVTDGLNNEYKVPVGEALKRIKHQTEVYNWQFVFLGANIDAEKEGAEMGLEKARATGYNSTDKGIRAAMKMSSDKISSYRCSGESVVMNYSTSDKKELVDAK